MYSFLGRRTFLIVGNEIHGEAICQVWSAAGGRPMGGPADSPGLLDDSSFQRQLAMIGRRRLGPPSPARISTFAGSGELWFRGNCSCRGLHGQGDSDFTLICGGTAFGPSPRRPCLSRGSPANGQRLRVVERLSSRGVELSGHRLDHGKMGTVAGATLMTGRRARNPGRTKSASCGPLPDTATAHDCFLEGKNDGDRPWSHP